MAHFHGSGGASAGDPVAAIADPERLVITLPMPPPASNAADPVRMLRREPDRHSFLDELMMCSCAVLMAN